MNQIEFIHSLLSSSLPKGSYTGIPQSGWCTLILVSNPKLTGKGTNQLKLMSNNVYLFENKPEPIVASTKGGEVIDDSRSTPTNIFWKLVTFIVML